MRLMGQISREYKGKEYFKHWIIIPKNILAKLKWKKGDVLEADIHNKKLVVNKCSKSSIK